MGPLPFPRAGWAGAREPGSGLVGRMVPRVVACAVDQPPSGQSTAPTPAAAPGLLSGAVLPQTRPLTPVICPPGQKGRASCCLGTEARGGLSLAPLPPGPPEPLQGQDGAVAVAPPPLRFLDGERSAPPVQANAQPTPSLGLTRAWAAPSGRGQPHSARG